MATAERTTRPDIGPPGAAWRAFMIAIGVTAGIIAGTAAGKAMASPYQDHGRIRLAAEQYGEEVARSIAPAGAETRAIAGRLDPRLQLGACPLPLETFSAPGHQPAARISVGVRCPVANGWSLYLPVRVEVLTDVIVLAVPAARGEPLTESHLRRERRDVAQLAGGYLRSMEEVREMTLRRPVIPGSVLTPQVLEPQKIVKRGQRVQLISGSGGFAVVAEGEALSDAARGERLRARNLRSKQVVEGVVEADGRIRISGAA